MTKRILVIAALAAVAIAPVAAQEAETPEYKWTKGDTIHYRLDIQKVSKATGAQQAEVDQTWFYLYDAEVKDVAPDGTAAIQVKFGPAGVRFQIPAKNIDFSYDPGNPEDEKRAGSPLALPFVALRGETITYRVAKTGKLLGLEGLQELFQKIGEKVKAAPQGAGYYGIAMTALDDLRTTQVETMFRRLPEKPLKPGETSYKSPKIRESNPAVGNVLLQSQCTIKADAGSPADAWSIACEIARTPEPPAAGAPPAPGKLAETKASSEFLLAKNGGAMLKNVYTSVLAVEQTLPPAANADPAAPPATVTQRDEITAKLERQAEAAPPAAPPAEPPAGS